MWNEYVRYYLTSTGINSIVRGIGQASDGSPSGLDKALQQVSFAKKLVRNMGWEDIEFPDGSVLFAKTIEENQPQKKQEALILTEKLLKWGLIELDNIPDKMKPILGPEHLERQPLLREQLQKTYSIDPNVPTPTPVPQQ